MNKNWLTALLVVSVSINLLLVGVVMGRALFGPEDRPPLDWAMTELSEDTRQSLKQQMRKHRHETMPIRRDFRAAQKELRKILEQAPYDPVAVEQAFSRLRQATGAMQISMHTQMTQVLADLSPEERIKVYRALSHPRGPSGRRPGGGRPADGSPTDSSPTDGSPADGSPTDGSPTPTPGN